MWDTNKLHLLKPLEQGIQALCPGT